MEPISVTLFTYRVGFGDCFLLRFSYPDRPRHVLIDFGSTAAAKNSGKQPMLAVARDVAAKCGGKLDAIVATHRHADHISGFQGKPWEVLKKLKPELVLLPWTEHQGAEVNARAAPEGRIGALGLESASLMHIGSLDAMHETAAAVLEEVKHKGGAPEGSDEAAHPEEGELELGDRPFGKRMTETLTFLGEDNLANTAAVKNLMGIETRDYLAFGDVTRLSQLLPGVTIDVLGPPTLEQAPGIVTQRAADQSEFWLAATRAARQSAAKTRLFPKFPTVDRDDQPLEVRWFLRKMDAVRGEQLLSLVRILDDAMNNTSLILLFTVLGKKLLFPGDAQLENWSHALAQPDVREKLKGVDVYKVGHHGSMNATPKSLWKLFGKRGPGKTLKTFMSTRLGKHGHAQAGTEVPRRPLVDALETESTLFSTLSLTKQDELVHEEVVAP